MGKSILKSHYLKTVQGECYQDGYFGSCDDDTKHLMLPVQDSTSISDIIKFFRLQRKPDQPGLSVIIPWPDWEIDVNTILNAVVKDYFFPLLTGMLEVEIVSDDNSPIILNNISIKEITHDLTFTSDCKDLPHVIQFAEEVTDTSILREFKLNRPASGTAWKWSDEMFPESIQDQIRLDYMSGKPISISVPVLVREKNLAPKESFFKVYLKRSEADIPIRQIFIREGIIIPRVNGKKLRSTIGIVYAEDEPIASFLRDSENPSHTEWQYRSSKFKGKYVSGSSDIEFVRQSITAISDFLSSDEHDEDTEILSEYFPLQEDISERKQHKPSKRKGDKPDVPIVDVPVKPMLYSVNEILDGFRISGIPSAIKGIESPIEISARVAYVIRDGDSVKRYSKFDFDFSKMDSSGLTMNSRGVEFISLESNYLRFTVLDPDFLLEIRGFDQNRDLYVRVRKLRIQ